MVLEEIKELLPQYLPHVSKQKINKLTQYLFFLKKWNRVYNLTSITTAKAMVIRHILDSLSVLDYLKGDNIIDVGTGAGLPGIPLSIIEEDKEFFLLDSNTKKTRFLKQIKMELELDNIVVVNARVEEYAPPICFDTVIARAFSSLVEFLNLSKKLVTKDGIFLAMKGVYPLSEIDTVNKNEFTIQKIEKLTVPDLNAERHVVEVVKSS